MSSLIKPLEHSVLYNANSPWTSLTNHNIIDNIILAFALFLTAIFFRSALTLVLYNHIRCFTNPHERSYWAVSRVLIVEHMTRTWLPAFQRPKSSVLLDKYKERNRRQYVLSISFGVFLLIMEVILIILAVPGKREFKIPSNRAIHVEIKAPKKPLMALFQNNNCLANEKISGVNLQSQGQWNYCAFETHHDLEKWEKTALFFISTYEDIQLITTFKYLNKSVISIFRYTVALNDTNVADVRISGKDIVQRSIIALEANLRMMEGITNLYVADNELIHESENKKIGLLVLDARNATLAGHPGIDPGEAARMVLNRATAAILHTRKPGTDTPPLQVLDWAGSNRLVDYNEPIPLGFYNGPIITTLGSLIMALISFVIYISTNLIYRSPGNMAWEVIISYGRKYGDVLLSGPDRILNWSNVVSCEDLMPSESDDEYERNVGEYTASTSVFNRTVF